MTLRKTVQQMLLEDVYSWNRVGWRFFKFSVLISFSAFLLWAYDDVFKVIYGLWGEEISSRTSAQKKWHWMIFLGIILAHFISYIYIFYYTMKGDVGRPGYRIRELKRLLYNAGGKNGIDMDGFCLLNSEKKIKNIKRFSGLDGEQVVAYFLELTAKNNLPGPMIFHKKINFSEVENFYVYEVFSAGGFFRLRGVDFNADHAPGKIRWAIEIPWQAVSVKIYSDFSVYNHEVNWGKWELHFE